MEEDEDNNNNNNAASGEISPRIHHGGHERHNHHHQPPFVDIQSSELYIDIPIESIEYRLSQAFLEYAAMRGYVMRRLKPPTTLNRIPFDNVNIRTGKYYLHIFNKRYRCSLFELTMGCSSPIFT